MAVHYLIKKWTPPITFTLLLTSLSVFPTACTKVKTINRNRTTSALSKATDTDSNVSSSITDNNKHPTSSSGSQTPVTATSPLPYASQFTLSSGGGISKGQGILLQYSVGGLGTPASDHPAGAAEMRGTGIRLIPGYSAAIR